MTNVLVGGTEMEEWKDRVGDSLRKGQQRQQERMKNEQQEKMAVEQNRGMAVEFVTTTVQRAFPKLQNDLRRQNIRADMVPKGTSATIHVTKDGGLPTKRRDFEWTVEVVLTASVSSHRSQARASARTTFSGMVGHSALTRSVRRISSTISCGYSRTSWPMGKSRNSPCRRLSS